uniref:uncharacterized protein LOC100185218 isoform X2 n=1 Tax=Ciona intestinalis TaxID=7719 RepID=UPI000EF4C3EB|nr:uncharacterized protein LOC100185218 isoform X2 [Ciona intestinalis]|eukprot:XP_026696477.1 uncharacterized protein LOC100185218 isoform X2 [Ciona intestinalis]
MNKPDFVTIHSGKLIAVKSEQINDPAATNIVGDVYELSGQVLNKFQSIQSTFKGLWNIVCICKVMCNATGVVQAFILLQNAQSSRCLHLLTLVNFKSIQTVFVYKHSSSLSAVKVQSIYITNGPAVVIYNPAQRCFLCLSHLKGYEVKKYHSPVQDLETFYIVPKNSTQTIDIIASVLDNQTSKNISSKGCSSKKDCSWKKLSWVPTSNTPIQVKTYENIPNVYCTVTTSFVSHEDVVLFTTTKGQLIFSRNNKVIQSCEVPLTSCNAIYVVGKGELSIAVVHDRINSTCCSVRLSTFEVLESWTNVSGVAFGPLSVSRTVHNCVIILKIPSGLQQMGKNEFVLLSAMEDYLYEKEKQKSQAEKVEPMIVSSTCGSDVDDLFASSPPLSEQHPDLKKRNKDGLDKAMKVLKTAIQKQKSELEEMRMHLDQKDDVIANYTAAVQEMNNNVGIDDTKHSQLTTGQLVDMFSGVPCNAHKVEELPKMFEKLKPLWQQTVGDNWFIGITLRNITKRIFLQFGIIITSCDDKFANEKMKHNFKPDYETQTSCSVLQNTQDDYELPTNKESESTTVQPGQEFVVVATTNLPNFSSVAQPSFLVTLITHCTDETGKLKRYLACLGEISVAATKVACGDIEIKPANFTIKCSALNRFSALLRITSQSNDTKTLCKIVLEKLGFKQVNNVQWMIGDTPGPFYLVQVVMHLGTNKSVHICLFSRCKSKANLLKTCFSEHLPEADIAFIEENELIENLGKDNLLKQETTLSSIVKQDENNDCFIVQDSRESINHKDAYIKLLSIQLNQSAQN